MQTGANEIFKYIDKNEFSKAMTALQRRIRWSTSLNEGVAKLYKTLEPMAFKGNMKNPKDIEDFVEQALNHLNDSPERTKHYNENGFLQGTLDRDGNTWNHTK